MGARGDVDQVVLGVGVECVAPGEVVQHAVDLLEIPGIAQRDLDAAHLGFRRDGGDVVPQALEQATAARVVQQFQPVDDQVFLLAQSDGRAPALPALVALAGIVQHGADKADGHGFLHECGYKNR